MCKYQNVKPNDQRTEINCKKKKKKTGEKEKDIIEVCKGMSRKELDNILNKKSTFPSRPIKHKSTHKPKPVKNKPLIKVDEFESVTQRL